MKVAIVIPYFNPVGYHSHSRKLARCLDSFDAAGLSGDVFLAGAGAQVKSDVRIAFWDDECDFMWHKERLVNLASRRLPSSYTHVAWVDNDVLVGPEWMPEVEKSLMGAKISQCFRSAAYIGNDGRISETLSNAKHASRNGTPGLAWGACRSFFDEGPGLFELALVGGEIASSHAAYSIDHRPLQHHARCIRALFGSFGPYPLRRSLMRGAREWESGLEVATQQRRLRISLS